MRIFGQQATYVMTHPGAFALRVVRAFRTNQGLLLAGAVAYYTLLSIIPLLILILIALSRRYVRYRTNNDAALAPAQSRRSVASIFLH